MQDTPDFAFADWSRPEKPMGRFSDRELIGLLGRGQIIRALKELGPDAKVGQAMVAEIPTIESRRRLDEAFHLLQEKSARRRGLDRPCARRLRDLAV